MEKRKPLPTLNSFSISNLGDLIDQSDAYTAGAQNTAMKAFIYCTGNNWNTDSNYVSTFSMATESNTGASTTMATVETELLL